MADIDLKLAIQSSIKAFADGNISENTLALFSTLGYNTERQNPFDQKNYQTFRDNFLDGDTRFSEEKARVNEWKSVDLLFQLSKEEISLQRGLFTTKKVKWEGEDKETVIETYLFFAIELAEAEYTRTALAQITREVNKVFPMPAMIVFKYGGNITLSVINRRIHKRDETRDVLEKVTLIKDISIENPHRAHIEILFDLSFDELLRIHNFTNFVELHNAWQKTLDTKELNKRFYRELSNWYFWAMQEVTFPGASLEADRTGVFKDEERIREHNAKNLIRLLTRILFVWFIKEKNLIPEVLFDESYIKNNLIDGFEPRKKRGIDYKTQGGKYYRAILQNLFFATLNQSMGKREFRKDGQHMNVTNLMRYESYFRDPEAFIELLEDVVPFMNGGLFECLDKPDPDLRGRRGGDVIIYEDGFSDRSDNELCVPDYIFFADNIHADLSVELGDKKQKNVAVKGLVNILKSYKFTVTENTPIEEDIALDPELLGQVFENLLASYNPETKTTARKQTCSFYTPREIVNYMVDESLKAYLQQKLEDEADMDSEDAEIGLEFLVGYYDKENLFDAKQTNVLINAIDNCKILDPACGSGAFPMGILHKLVHILHKLDPQNERWKERQIEKAQAIDDAVIREQLIEDIKTAFTNNELDYGRKLYLIENCIYGVDIQPIATQISKLRFFISLIVDQRTDRARDNFGILPLPNLETKFVTANTLIGIEKPKKGDYAGSLFDNKVVSDLEEKLRDVRHRLFSAKTPATKRKMREEDQKLREKMGEILTNSGWDNETARQLANWDPYDQSASSPFFDPEWMFGISEGFDVVIGNPPYGLLNKRQNKAESIIVSEKELEYFKNSEYYLPARGGMLNIFRLFILKSIRLLSIDGVFSEIFPLAFVGDLSIAKLREYILDNNQILSIEAFPERDNPNKRVFEVVKMSVCILNLKNRIDSSEFFIRINHDRFIDETAEKNHLNKEVIKALDQRYLSFPLTSSSETDLLVKIFRKGRRFSEFGKCNTGEIDMTFCKKAFSDDSENAILLKGAIIDRYLLREKMSQGEIVYIDEKKLFRIKKVNRDLKNQERIVLQGITGINERIRLKMMIIKDAYCANSLNYLSLNEEMDKKYLLGIFNSKLLNFVFSKFSTNSNVNGYEVDNLPISLNDEFCTPIGTIVDYILLLKRESEDSTFFESLVDTLVYELYFPEKIRSAGCEVLSYSTNLSQLKGSWGDAKKLSIIKEICQRLSNPTHPVSIAMEKTKTLPEVRIIEGLDK